MNRSPDTAADCSRALAGPRSGDYTRPRGADSHGVHAQPSFDVLLVSPSEYRIDGAFRYEGTELPQAGELITVVDELAGTEREALVRRVSHDAQFAIHATDLTPLPPERWVAPHERSRRHSQDGAQGVFNARRGWLNRRRRRSAA